MMDSNSNFKCNICNICVTTVNAFVAHNNGKRHKLALKMKNSEVCIKGLPTNVDEVHLKKFFASFGPLKLYYFAPENKIVVFQYKSEQIAQNIIKNGVIYCSQKLIVQPTIGTEFISVPEAVKPNPCEQLAIMLQNGSFDRQVDSFLQIMQPYFGLQMQKFQKLCTDLHLLLNMAFQNCTLHPFGSTSTGLFFADSDVDIYVQLPQIKQIKTCSPASLIFKAKHIMMTHANISFIDVIAIPKGKIPIVKCIHLETNIHCDFHFMNLLGVCNSNLIKYYASLDNKIKPIMLILKLWAKINGLTKHHHNFSSYSMIMMCIFYLQKCFLLPSVKDLQMNPKQDSIHGSWNGGFEHLPYYHEDLINIKTIDLLKGFFDFYLYFDFNTDIVCPFLGYELPKTFFKSALEMPNYYKRYKENSMQGMILDFEKPICVQDPFEHCLNITRHVNKDILDKFQNGCRYAGTLLEHQNLYELFANKLSDVKLLHLYKEECAQFRIGIGSSLNYLEQYIKENIDKQLTIEMAWYQTFEKFLYTSLEDVFKFQLDAEIINKKEFKSDETVNQQETYNSSFDILKIHCTGTLDLWTLRKTSRTKFTIPSNIDTILQREEYISNQMQSSSLLSNKIKCCIDINIYMRARVKPTEVDLQIKTNKTNKCSFKAFTSYFIKQIPTWYHTYEKELDDQINKSSY